MKSNFFKTAIVGSFILITSSSCKENKNKELAVDATEVTTEVIADAQAPVPDAARPSHPDAIPLKDQDTTIQRMLTKEGTLSWETTSAEKTHAALLAKAKKYNAYISNDNQTRDEIQTTTRMQMRIPSDKFDEFISGMEKEVSRFDEKRIEVLDVTEEYIDVSARMKTKKELEQHYYDLLKQTKNVTEVLQVEEQLNTVRADIESAEGRLKYLKDKVSMSTLNLTFYETTSAPVGFFGKIGKSFIDGWKSLLYFFLNIIAAWPVILFAGGLVIWLVRRRKRNKNNVQ